MKIITLNKHQFRWIFAFVEYDFKIKYCFEKINSIDDFLKRFDYEKNANDEICLFTLQNKLKNIIVIIINLISVITRGARRTHAQRKKNIIETLSFKKINEKNVEEFFNVEKNDLFHNAVTQQFCYNDVCKTCNDEQQMKSFFKLLMIKLEEFQKKNSIIIKI